MQSIDKTSKQANVQELLKSFPNFIVPTYYDETGQPTGQTTMAITDYGEFFYAVDKAVVNRLYLSPLPDPNRYYAPHELLDPDWKKKYVDDCLIALRAFIEKYNSQSINLEDFWSTYHGFMYNNVPSYCGISSIARWDRFTPDEFKKLVDKRTTQTLK